MPKMMRSYYILLLIAVSVFAQDMYSQQPQQQRRTPQQRRQAEAAAESDLPSLTVRANSKNEDQAKQFENMVWVREIYRYLDLTKEQNSPLYYPVQPIGDRMNLFTLVFKLLAHNKITAYRYLDGREVFTDEYKINFLTDVVRQNQILYTTTGNGNDAQIEILDSDIPGNEVTMYMIKEAFYFDQATSMFHSQVLAICPMLVRQDDDFGQSIRTPLFWIPYENIRPYLSRTHIMTSNLNNALTYTIDDYFSKRMYDGEIVKTTNMMNQNLAQQVGNDSASLKRAQDSIEKQLKFFEQKLWIEKDTTKAVAKTKKSSSKTRGSSSSSESNATKAEKPKTQKAEKSSSAPARSVRRR